MTVREAKTIFSVVPKLEEEEGEGGSLKRANGKQTYFQIFCAFLSNSTHILVMKLRKS
jgi:hypothetical protein